MKRKNTIKSTAALMLGLALTVGATGCSFVLTDSEADLKRENDLVILNFVRARSRLGLGADKTEICAALDGYRIAVKRVGDVSNSQEGIRLVRALERRAAGGEQAAKHRRNHKQSENSHCLFHDE